MSHTLEQSHGDARGLLTSLWKHNMADAAQGGLPGELERRGEVSRAGHLDERQAERGRRLLLLLTVPGTDQPPAANLKFIGVTQNPGQL